MNKMEKQTAVEWLFEQMSSSKFFYYLMEDINNRNTVEQSDIFEQAKEMEKEQQGYNEEEAYSIWRAGQNYGVTSGSSITFEELTKLLRNKKK